MAAMFNACITSRLDYQKWATGALKGQYTISMISCNIVLEYAPLKNSIKCGILLAMLATSIGAIC